MRSNRMFLQLSLKTLPPNVPTYWKPCSVRRLCSWTKILLKRGPWSKIFGFFEKNGRHENVPLRSLQWNAVNFVVLTNLLPWAWKHQPKEWYLDGNNLCKRISPQTQKYEIDIREQGRSLRHFAVWRDLLRWPPILITYNFDPPWALPSLNRVEFGPAAAHFGVIIMHWNTHQ